MALSRVVALVCWLPVGVALAQSPAATPPETSPSPQTTTPAAPEQPAATPPAETAPAPETPPAAAPAPAAEAAPVQLQDVEELDLEALLISDVAAAAKVEQRPQEAPSIVTSIPRSQLNAYGWTTINDVLYRQPSFAPARDYERRTVTSRGTFESWNNNHLLLLIDGIPFNDNLYGTAYTWEITPLVFASSLEVVRGPGSALYGSNATNGVVALKTLSAERNEIWSRVRMGDYGTKALDVVGTHLGSVADVVLSYTDYRTQGDEYLSPDGSGRTRPDGSLETFLVQDARASQYFFAKVDATGNLKGLSLQFHQQSWNFGTGHGWLWWIPDFKESMNESRQLITARYVNGDATDRWTQEYAVRFQRHNVNWNIRFSPDNAYSGFYPAGVTEFLDTHADEVFARAQVGYRFLDKMQVLAGVEDSLFLYNGDNDHYSNTDLTDFAGGYPPSIDTEKLGPWFEWIQGQPVNNVGVYAQFLSGSFLRELLSVTLGVRYDNKSFKYVDIADPARPTRSRSFDQVSPRAALVISPTRDLSFKLMGGRAFRAPAPSELFGANTFTLASNIAVLKPEIVTTYEAAADWTPVRSLRLRLNGYHKRYENLIAYSVSAGNLSTNVFSQRVAGGELEALYTYSLGAAGSLGGFANYSYVRLIDEVVQDLTITANNRGLTWAPSHTANLGLRFERGDFSAAAQLHVQGEVGRRASDRLLAQNLGSRPQVVPAWASVDLRLAYQITDWVMVAADARNLFNTNAPLVKNNDYPFDYRQEGRRLMASAEFTF